MGPGSFSSVMQAKPFFPFAYLQSVQYLANFFFFFFVFAFGDGGVGRVTKFGPGN